MYCIYVYDLSKLFNLHVRQMLQSKNIYAWKIDGVFFSLYTYFIHTMTFCNLTIINNTKSNLNQLLVYKSTNVNSLFNQSFRWRSILMGPLLQELIVFSTAATQNYQRWGTASKRRQLLDARLCGLQTVTQYAWHLCNFIARELPFIQQIVQHLFNLFEAYV